MPPDSTPVTAGGLGLVPESEPETQDQPENRQDDPKRDQAESNDGAKPNLTPCTRVPGLLLLAETREPHSYIEFPGAHPQRVSVEEGGLVFFHETPIAHVSETGAVRPAFMQPDEISTQFLLQVAACLARDGVYIHNELITVQCCNAPALPQYSLHPIPSTAAFDSILSNSIAFPKYKVVKGVIEGIYVRPLDNRTVAAVFASPTLRQALPKISVINPVSLPYFPEGSAIPAWNPVGYNPESQVFTTGDSAEVTGKTLCEMLEWHRQLMASFLFKDERDYRAFVAITMGGYCSEMLVPLLHGCRMGRAIIPASLIASNRSGSGKSLLVKLAALATYGVVDAEVPPKADEIQATLVTALVAGKRCVFLDEAAKLITDQLLTCVTDIGNGRVKGESRNVRGNLQLYLAAKDADISEMMSRRVLVCNLLSREDYLTADFDKATITPANIHLHRPMLLAFGRVLVENWIAKGMPEPAEKQGSQWFEFSKLVGGIMEAAGLKAPFLECSAATDFASGENDHIDAQWPSYFESLAKGELTLVDSGGNTIPLEGEHRMVDIFAAAREAGFFQMVREDNVRAFGAAIKTWKNTGTKLHGYTMTSKKANDGARIKFIKVS